MARRKRKNARLKLLNEIRDQLVLQAERWEKKGYYTPLRLEEITLEQCRKVAGDLLSEKANLGYELHLLDSNKRDLLIKMERLQSYVKRAYRVIEKHEKSIRKHLDKMISDKDKLEVIMRRMQPESSISILLNSN